MELRLQKYLADCGVCSRRKAEELIVEGMVRVNGAVVTQLGTKVDPENDAVAVGKRMLKPRGAKLYYVFNKPVGIVSTCAQEGTRTVLDFVRAPGRVYPVGRLDKESSGLILLTNDGDLAHRLMHPKFEHEKEYIVEHAGSLEPEEIMRLVRGVRLRDAVTQRAEVHKITGRKFRITLREGRHHQIRRMLESVGSKVIGLKRIRIGPLTLGKMAPGEWRSLTTKERADLLRSAGIEQPGAAARGARKDQHAGVRTADTVEA